ncbi:hypothetical protein GCM10020220_033940 [Nonomuraea rubra]
MPSAVGSSMATVAVFETNADSRHVIRPNATTSRNVERPTPGSDNMRKAKRRATPCLSIACARMNAPMKVNSVGEPSGVSASVAEATPSSTITPTPMSPPTGMGTGSVTHNTMTPSSTAASVCCSASISMGSSRKAAVTSGASHRPVVRLAFSKRSSAGVSRCSARPP